jgi:hypothetical protein
MYKLIIIVLLFPFIASSQDSLWVESPAIKDVSTAAVTVGEEITTTGGRLKAIKFYKNETAGNYIITLYQQSNGASIFSQSYRSTTIGWQRITMDLPLEPGTYVVAVYYPNGRYVYTDGLNPRTRGNLKGNAGLYAGQNFKPVRQACCIAKSFFVDVVIAQTIQPVMSTLTPDSVNVAYPWNPVTLQATASNAVSYGWKVEDSTGTWVIDTTNRLRPVITAKSHGNLFLVFTATGADGLQWSSISIIYSEPDPNKITGYILSNGSTYFRRSIMVF